MLKVGKVGGYSVVCSFEGASGVVDCRAAAGGGRRGRCLEARGCGADAGRIAQFRVGWLLGEGDGRCVGCG